MFQGRAAARAAEYLGQFPGPIKLVPSTLKWIPILVGMTFVVALGAIFVFLFFLDGGVILLPIGLLLFFYCGFVVLRSMLAFASGRMWLTLDEHGFAYRFPGHDGRATWDGVAEFEVWPVQYLNYVTYADGKPTRWWQLNRLYFGGGTWIPDTYGLGAENLAALMNAWRKRALAQPGSGEPYGSSSVSQ